MTPPAPAPANYSPRFVGAALVIFLTLGLPALVGVCIGMRLGAILLLTLVVMEVGVALFAIVFIRMARAITPPGKRSANEIPWDDEDDREHEDEDGAAKADRDD